MKVEGNAIRVKFTHATGVVWWRRAATSRPSPSPARAWGKFVPATARIDQGTVVVSSPDAAAPAAVRYAWSNYPEGCNLYNADGLPAAPFRTDKL